MIFLFSDRDINFERRQSATKAADENKAISLAFSLLPLSHKSQFEIAECVGGAQSKVKIYANPRLRALRPWGTGLRPFTRSHNDITVETLIRAYPVG